jgi:LacI family transcriptional regulator
MRKTRQVALAFPLTVGIYEDSLQGIMEYVRKHGPWSFLCGSETLTISLLALRNWKGDGVIAAVTSRREANAALKLGLPVVNLAGTLADVRLPRVMNDHRAIGRQAAEHLLGCGFRHFAYYGLKNAWFSEERAAGFAERVEEEGHPCAMLKTSAIADQRGGWCGRQRELKRWMKSQPRPLAVMAVNDALARMVVDVCRGLGMRVPYDVAVVGVGNQPVLCEASEPTISSVARNGKEIGYRAAQYLDRQMSGRQPAKQDVFVAPAGVVTRQSTDVVAVDDPDLSLAVQRIHECLNRPFRVESLVRELNVSRRWLEYRFRQSLGLSPYEYICQARVKQVRDLLLEPRKIPDEELAERCGFSSVRHLQRAFQRVEGVTPTQYRKSHCPKAPDGPKRNH